MTSTLRIRGMHAVHAVRAIETALGGLNGVRRAHVSLGQAVVDHEDRVTPGMLIDAVEVAGFEVESWDQQRRRLPTL